jgi:predicted lipoprotein with Yx(FWY)xxD motif
MGYVAVFRAPVYSSFQKETRIMKNVILILLAQMVFAGAAFAGDLNPLRLTNDAGMPLYTYEKDTDGVSNCAGQCAKAWPPVVAPEGTLDYDLSVVVRADGTRQLAREKQPLYTFVNDKPGVTTGDGVGGFHIARP